MRNKYIKEIEDYQDVIEVLIEPMINDICIHEEESVYSDILEYQENNFDGWTKREFKEFIKYLEQLTGLKSKLREV